MRPRHAVNSSSSDEAARAAAERAESFWREIKSLYPREALQIMPPLWSCPMHQELMKTAAGNCPICGMPLEPIYVTQPQLTQDPIIRAEIVANRPLEVGNALIYEFGFCLSIMASRWLSLIWRRRTRAKFIY